MNSVTTLLTSLGTRLTEASSYAGFAAIFSAFGIGLSQAVSMHGPALWVAIVAAVASGVAAVAKQERLPKVESIATEVATVATEVETSLTTK